MLGGGALAGVRCARRPRRAAEEERAGDFERVLPVPVGLSAGGGDPVVLKHDGGVDDALDCHEGNIGPVASGGVGGGEPVVGREVAEGASPQQHHVNAEALPADEGPMWP